jgi:hypothetical protein
MKRIVLVWLSIIVYPCFTQSTVEPGDTLSEVNKLDIRKEYVVEVYKIKSGKTFRLERGRTVWVYCKNLKGKRKMARTKITDIGAHSITFLPSNSKFQKVTYSDSTILYIGFTSADRIIMATISDLVIIGAVVVLYTAVIIGDFFTGGTGRYPAISWVPLVPFKRNIYFIDGRSQVKWGIRIVEIKRH